MGTAAGSTLYRSENLMAFDSPPTARWALAAVGGAGAFEIAGRRHVTVRIHSVDGATGRMLAYNQLVKRDPHDWDVDAPPTLVTTRAGKRIIASANKDALLSILDRGGISRDLRPDVRGIQTVLALRAKYATPPKALGEPAKYVDLTWYEKAFGAR